MKNWIKRANWLKVAGGFTVVYLIAALAIIGPCRAWAFVTTGALNEIGDFLAGVFSPLAFIWLVAAVLTQRQELDETREQFGELQVLNRAQMDSIKSQNSLASLQFAQTQHSATQTYRLNLFDKRFDLYDRLVKLRDVIVDSEISFSTSDQLRRITDEMAFVFGGDIEDEIRKIGDMMTSYLQMRTQILVTSGYGNIVVSNLPEHKGVRDELDLLNKRVIAALGPVNLRNLLWSSMRVSDD